MLYFAFNTRGITGSTDSTMVQNVTKTEEINMSDEFAFDIHVTNSVYHLIQAKLTQIIVYDDVSGDIEFVGRVTTTKEDSGKGTKSVTCHDGLSYLNDSFYDGPDGKKGQPFINYFINQMTCHNTQVGNDQTRTFNSVVYDSTNLDSQTTSGILQNDMEFTGKRTFDVFRDVMSELTWEMQLTYQLAAPHFTVAFAPYFGFKSRTPIVTGLNLKNLTKDRDFGEFYTRIYPIGGYCYDEKRLRLPSNNTNYSSSDDTTTWYDEVDNVNRKCYVENSKLVSKYGIYSIQKVYDDVVANSEAGLAIARHNLYVNAYNDAKKLTDRKETIQVQGYDLYKAGYPLDELKVHNYYQCIDTVTGIVVKARLKKMTKYYDKPFEPSLTLEYDGMDLEAEVI
jgi:hypothetical protein